MQRLPIASRLFADAASGAKTHTIRWREARIVPGPLTFHDAAAPARTARVAVHRCTDMPLREAAAFVGRAADWPDDVMLEGMRAHYPAIALDDTVQVIEFAAP